MRGILERYVCILSRLLICYETESNVMFCVIFNFPAQHVLDGPKDALPPPSCSGPLSNVHFGRPQKCTPALPAGSQQDAIGMAPESNSPPPPSIPPSLPRLLESSCILVAQGARFFTLNKDKSCKVRFPGLQNHTSAIWRAKRHKSEQGTPTRKAKHPTRVFLQSSGNSHSL